MAKKPTTISGMMNSVIVLQNGVRVGYGYIFLQGSGEMMIPLLFDFNGEAIEGGQFYDMQVQNDERLILISKSKH